MPDHLNPKKPNRPLAEKVPLRILLAVGILRNDCDGISNTVACPLWGISHSINILWSFSKKEDSLIRLFREKLCKSSNVSRELGPSAPDVDLAVREARKLLILPGAGSKF